MTKLSPGGSSLEYSSYFGGIGIDVANAIAVDAGGDAYITGETYSADLPTTSGAFQATYTDEEAFVTKLSADGGSLAYSTYLGSSSQGYGIAVDSSGDTYITGNTSSGSFPVTPGAYQTTYGGDFDAFVTKLSADGGSLVYSTYLGGSSGEEGYAIALDSSGEAWITGGTGSGDFPVTFDASQPSLGGKDDAFVTQVSAAGSSLLYSTYLGGSSYEEGKGIGVDSSGDAYIAGDTESTDFPVTAGAYQTTDGNTADSGFVAGFGPGIATLTGLASAANPSTVNQPVVYTATVTDKRAPARGARPIPGGGRVAFSDGGTTISGCGAVALNSTTGVASCQISYAVAASHSIEAVYSGYSTYASSSSSALTQVVNAAATTPASATSTSAATSTPTSTTGSGAAPVLIHAPVITGTAKAKHRLSCSTGSWSGSPTSYDYAWSRGGVLLAGQTHASLTVVSLDEGTALTCRVTAINSAGSATAASPAVKVAVPKVAGCPAATGSLSGTKLGLITLGMTKVRAHEVFRKHSDRGTRYEDFFCLTPIGVRVIVKCCGLGDEE